MKLFKETKPFKLFEARQISRALMSLVCIPENMDPRDVCEIKFDLNTSTSWKLRNWYDDQILEWFDHINVIMGKYQKVEPRTIDVKRLMSGLSVREVCNLFITEYEEKGAILNDKHHRKRSFSSIR